MVQKYELIEFLGEGTYGQVIKAKSKETGEIVAVKLIKNIFKCVYQARLAYREIFILRKLSEIDGNIYTTKLIDIILPRQFEVIDDAVSIEYFNNLKNTPDDMGNSEIQIDLMTGKPSTELPSMKNMMKITYVFLVMDFVQTDFRKLLNSTPKTQLNDEHITTILYNQLCVLNFLHTANVVHRDLKPGNFLIDSTCNVKICDFGLARVMPSYSQTEKDLRKFQREIFKFKYSHLSLEQRKNRFNEVKESVTMALQQTNEEKAKRKREISSVIMSRWYRSPEVILTYPYYNQGADIWSLGCILAELIYCSQDYSKRPGFDNKKRFIFQGDSCFPISPKKTNDSTKESVSSGDQIIKICQRLRDLDHNDFSFISDPIIKEYV